MVLYGYLVVLVILFRPAGIMGTRELTFKDLRRGIGWIKGRIARKG